MIFSRLIKDSAVYGMADVLTKIISFFTFPIIAAALSPKAFGAMELIVTVTALLGLVMNCGLNNAVQRFYWDKDTTASMRPTIVTSGLYAQVGLGLLALLGGSVVIPFALPLIQSEAWPLSWIGLVAALLVMTFSQWVQYAVDVIRLHFKPWRFFMLAVVSRVATMILGIVAVVVLGLGVDGLLAAQALVLALALPLAVWLIRKDCKPRLFSKLWMKELIRFGYPFIFAGLAYWLFGAMDRWMLASMKTVDEVGVYSVAFRFASIVLFVSAAFGQAWSPNAMKIRTDHPEHYRVIYGQVLLVLLFGMLVVGGAMALFSGEVIGLFMPQDYHASAMPLAILCFGIIIQSSQQVTAAGISIAKKTYLFARIAWLTAAVNFGANLVLIPTYGALGAAWATLISYLLLSGAYLYWSQRLHPIRVQWGRLITLLLLGAVVATASLLFISLEVDGPILLFKLLLSISCLYLGLKILPLKSVRGLN